MPDTPGDPDLPDLSDVPYEIRKWLLEHHVLQQQKTGVKHTIEKLLGSSGQETTPETRAVATTGVYLRLWRGGLDVKRSE